MKKETGDTFCGAARLLSIYLGVLMTLKPVFLIDPTNFYR